LIDVVHHQESATASESNELDQPTRQSPSSMLQAAGILDPTENRFTSFTSKFHKLINRDRWSVNTPWQSACCRDHPWYAHHRYGCYCRVI